MDKRSSENILICDRILCTLEMEVEEVEDIENNEMALGLSRRVLLYKFVRNIFVCINI